MNNGWFRWRKKVFPGFNGLKILEPLCTAWSIDFTERVARSPTNLWKIYSIWPVDKLSLMLLNSFDKCKSKLAYKIPDGLSSVDPTLEHWLYGWDRSTPTWSTEPSEVPLHCKQSSTSTVSSTIYISNPVSLEYLQVVQTSLGNEDVGGGPDCVEKVRAAFAALATNMNTIAGRTTISEKFKY